MHNTTGAGAGRPFAWAGVFLFFVSLAYFLLAYGVRFAAPANGGRALPAVPWNVGLFTAFALHHSVFAREPVRRLVARWCPGALERSFYVWVASILFIAVCAWWQPVPGIAWQGRGAGVWGLLLLQGAGVVLALRSAAVLDVRELAGIRVGTPAADIVFKTTGPYGWVRHPIYAGWFLLVLAASPMTMTRLTFALVSCVYVLIAIPLEERTLRAAAPDAYARYAAQVRWRLVPGVY